jgi:hypothetical protein
VAVFEGNFCINAEAEKDRKSSRYRGIGKEEDEEINVGEASIPRLVPGRQVENE